MLFESTRCALALVSYADTSFSVSMVQHAACLFRTLIKRRKQAGSVLYFSRLAHNWKTRNADPFLGVLRAAVGLSEV